ncbi:hypothetical protein MMC11_006066 [Xylographa trunciseda]|nr:hypothetical protein [Xylographa trunciseda]
MALPQPPHGHQQQQQQTLTKTMASLSITRGDPTGEVVVLEQTQEKLTTSSSPSRAETLSDTAIKQPQGLASQSAACQPQQPQTVPIHQFNQQSSAPPHSTMYPQPIYQQSQFSLPQQQYPSVIGTLAPSQAYAVPMYQAVGVNSLQQQQSVQYQQPMMNYQGQLVPAAVLSQVQNQPGFYNAVGPQQPCQPVYTTLIPQQVQQAAVLPQHVSPVAVPLQQVPVQNAHQPKTKDPSTAGFTTGFFKGLSKTLQNEFQDLMPVSEKKESRSWKWGRGKASPTQEKTEAQISTQQQQAPTQQHPAPVQQKQAQAQDTSSAAQKDHSNESLPDKIMAEGTSLAENGLKDELDKFKDDSPSQQDTSASVSSQKPSALDAPAQPQYSNDDSNPQQQLPTADLYSASPYGQDGTQNYPQQLIGIVPPPAADLSSQGPFSQSPPLQQESFADASQSEYDTFQPQYDASTPSPPMYPADVGGQYTVDQTGDYSLGGEADGFEFSGGQGIMDDIDGMGTQSGGGGGFMSLFN